MLLDSPSILASGIQLTFGPIGPSALLVCSGTEIRGGTNAIHDGTLRVTRDATIDGILTANIPLYQTVASGLLLYAPLASGVANGNSHDHSGGDGAQIDHGGLGGLTDDDHSQYAYLAGRSGGQTLIGGTATTNSLTLRATSGNGTTGSNIIFQVGNNGGTEAARILHDGKTGIGTASPNAPLHIYAARSGATLNSTPMLRLDDSTAEAIDAGPELWFGGTAGGASTGYASIHAGKENATPGNYSTYLRLATRANGGSVTEKARISSGGKFLVNTTDTSWSVVTIKSTGSDGMDLVDSTGVHAISLRPSATLHQIYTNFASSTEKPLVFGTYTNRANQLYLGTDGKVSIGTASPASLFHIASSTTATAIETIEQASGDADGPDINLKKARGTVGSPTVVSSGDNLGALNFQGYSGAGGYVTGAAIKAETENTIATTRVPADLVFYTGTNAAPTVLTERMRILHDGKVGIGTASPTQALEIAGSLQVANTTSSTTGVIYKGGNRFIHDFKPAANDGYNLFIGANAGNFTMGGTGAEASYNVGIGYNTLQAATKAYYNVVIGGASAPLLTEGYGNAVIGGRCFSAATVAFNNVAIGMDTLRGLIGGSSNVAIGPQAMYTGSAPVYCIAIGTQALFATTGSYNTAIGVTAGIRLSSGANNTFIGCQAGFGSAAGFTGSDNTFIGMNAGYSASGTQTGCVFIGSNAGFSERNSNKLYISNSNTSTPLIGGDFSTPSVSINGSETVTGAFLLPGIADNAGTYAVKWTTTTGNVTYTSSDGRKKIDEAPYTKGLDTVEKLQPKEYTYLGANKIKDGVIDFDGTATRQVGLIAQEVYKVAPEVVYKPKDEGNAFWNVDYEHMIPMLINAIKELSIRIEKLEEKIK